MLPLQQAERCPCGDDFACYLGHHSVLGRPVFYLKPGALIIFQYRKHVREFFQPCCNLITPLVSEKYR
jgi:hypothetical protein